MKHNPMTAVKFPEANRELKRPASMTEEECKSLFVWTDGRQCVSCWKVPFWQRVALLFHGNIWLFVLMGSTQPPVSMACKNTVFQKPQNRKDA